MDKNGNSLRHVVMFRFKDGTSAEQIEAIAQKFGEMKTKISEIRAFEWGANISTEGHDRGFTHAFVATFGSEEDRDAYLPHDAHKALGDFVGPFVADVLVIDYWAQA